MGALLAVRVSREKRPHLAAFAAFLSHKRERGLFA